MDTTPELRPLNRRSFAADPRVRWALGVPAAAAVAFALARAIGAPVSDVVMLGSTIVAATAFFRASRRPSPLRRTLVLLGWSATAWVGGVGSWLGAEMLLDRGSGPNPVSSLLMIAGTALALAGVLAGPSAPTGLGRRMRLGLEGVLAAASVLFVVWEPLVDPLLRADGRESPSEFLTLVVPGTDLVFAGVIGALIWRWTNRRTPLMLLGLSAGLRAVTDAVFAYFALAGFPARGDAAVDIGWALTYATLALAALSGVGGAGASERRLRAPGRRSQLVTHLPVIAALGTAIFVGIVERHLRGAQLTILLLIAALMLMRQWITLNENRQLLDHVAFQAEHDDLTGLLNRVGLLRRLAEGVRSEAALRVHLVDIDRFKDVNDTLGHPVGDALLIAVGHRLRACARGLDVARLGGDEFAVIDPRHDGAGLAERLLAAVGEPYSAAGRSIHLDASLGIAELAANPGTTAGNADQVAVDLLRDADAAMYAAKADGGGWRLFEDELRDAMLDRVALGRELRDALARGGELSLVYQPIVGLADGGVPHVEALARWTSPRRGVVPPGVFIPIAEAAGLMPQLGTWVLRTACAQAAEWSRAGYDVGVCVNVSAQQAGPGLVHDVADVLRRTGLAPERLMLEVTESLFVADSEAGNSPLEAVRASGVGIAIDDFGTGYSALAYLRRLPVDTLKVDRRFLAHMDKTDVAVLAAILEMARALGLRTVAEGIETREQLAQLQALGCDLGQGYFLARPMDAQLVPAFLDPGAARAA
jgi:diguanylate cyclase (GGDEF)-like protein